MNRKSSAMIPLLLWASAATVLQAQQAVFIQGEGHTFGVAPGQFVGSATFSLSGVEHDVVSTTVLLDMIELPNGTILAETSHTFDLADGDSIITTDHQQLLPTATPGLYELEGTLTIVGGTGLYEHARGTLHTQAGSTMNFGVFPPEAIWFTEGVLTLRP